jgi:type I restriction enzyme S subunit
MTEIMLGNANPSWPVYRLSQLFRERRDKVNDRDFPPLSVTKYGIVPQLETAAKSDDGDNRKGVRAGDFVINSRSDRKGSSGLSELDGSVSLINIVLEPLGIHPRFAHHLLRSTAFQEEFYRWGHGIVADLWTTRYSDMKSIRLAAPDLETQKAIADFLDRETARIDQLIGKKRKLIGLLQERSLAAIDTAIRSEAKVTKLGHHVKILPGYAFSSSEFSTNEDEIRLLRGANVAPGQIRWDDVVYWPKTLAAGLERFYLAEGDVVMGMDRPWISGGIRVAELTSKDAPSLLLQRVCRITPLATLAKDFLKLLLSSKTFLGYFEPELTGVSVPHISADQIANFRFCYIPLPEQIERSVACNRKLHDNQRIGSLAAASIDRVSEFRAALITAAVTGQIDVANWGKRGRTQKHLEKIEARSARKEACA